MREFERLIEPDPQGFAADPIGYSSLAWMKWGMAQTYAGFDVDISKPPTNRDLKSPILWLTHAHALSEAAFSVLRREPAIDHLTIHTKGVCHSQYHAVALMLVGMSLETCLKAMIILREGIDRFIENESKHRHHRLKDLGDFVPDLSAKDLAILECLSQFVYWAGKYPDPGSARTRDAVAVFDVSEEHQISARDLFELASRVMRYSQVVIEESPTPER